MQVGGHLRKQEIATLEALLAEAGDHRGRRPSTQAAPRRVPDNELPVYTILVPAYREEAVIAKLIENLRGLDYPPEKLDVIVLLEEDDELTLARGESGETTGIRAPVRDAARHAENEAASLQRRLAIRAR